MPQKRVSRQFKDISLSFQINPINRDLVTISNQTAISRAVRNLVFTKRGERFFDYRLGSRVSSLLFDTLDYVTASSIELEISEVIRNYEPRVRLASVKATPNFDNNEIDVNIVYDIIGIDVPTQQLEFALQPTR